MSNNISIGQNKLRAEQLARNEIDLKIEQAYNDISQPGITLSGFQLVVKTCLDINNSIIDSMRRGEHACSNPQLALRQLKGLIAKAEIRISEMKEALSEEFEIRPSESIMNDNQNAIFNHDRIIQYIFSALKGECDSNNWPNLISLLKGLTPQSERFIFSGRKNYVRQVFQISVQELKSGYLKMKTKDIAYYLANKTDFIDLGNNKLTVISAKTWYNYLADNGFSGTENYSDERLLTLQNQLNNFKKGQNQR